MTDEYKALLQDADGIRQATLDPQAEDIIRQLADAIETLVADVERLRIEKQVEIDILVETGERAERYKAALGAIGAIGNGYCFCFCKMRDPEQPDDWHLPECRDARKALQDKDDG